MTSWSPYVVGVLIGVLNLSLLLLYDKLLGASTSYAKLSGMITNVFNKRYVKENAFYQKTSPQVDWGVMLVFGIILGSFISSSLSGDFRIISVPDMWSSEISGNIFARFLASVTGGILLGFGSRWGGGCTSGHGISGTSQLSVLSWISSIGFFVGGIATAMIIYGL